MAIFLPGMCCSICKNPILEHDDMLTLPAFFLNQYDSLYLFNDAVVHQSCFDDNYLNEEYMMLFSKFLNKKDCKICDVCGKPIICPDDYIFLGCMTSDTKYLLSKFNFTVYHSVCLKNSQTWEEISQEIATMKKIGKWKGSLDIS